MKITDKTFADHFKKIWYIKILPYKSDKELITSIKKGFTQSFLWTENLPKVRSVEFDLLNLIYTWPFQEDTPKCKARTVPLG